MSDKDLRWVEVVPGEPHNKVPPPAVIERVLSGTRESTAPVGIGGVVLHHSHTLHTSHVNRSQRWRRGYATHHTVNAPL